MPTRTREEGSRPSRPPALYLVAADGEPPASRRPGSTGLGIPTYSDALVGRAAELRQLDHLVLEERARLVTILGPGGMGKTRLVSAWAENALRAGLDVAYAPLASLTSAERPTRTITSGTS